jgi:hypothetical protein
MVSATDFLFGLQVSLCAWGLALQAQSSANQQSAGGVAWQVPGARRIACSMVQISLQNVRCKSRTLSSKLKLH